MNFIRFQALLIVLGATFIAGALTESAEAQITTVSFTVTGEAEENTMFWANAELAASFAKSNAILDALDALDSIVQTYTDLGFSVVVAIGDATCVMNYRDLPETTWDESDHVIKATVELSVTIYFWESNMFGAP